MIIESDVSLRRRKKTERIIDWKKGNKIATTSDKKILLFSLLR